MSLPPGPNLAEVEMREVAPDPLPPRPATIRAAVVLMVLGGVIAALDAAVKVVAWDRDEVEQRLVDAGVSPGNLEGFFTIVRIVGFVGGLVIAGVWVLHAIASDRGRTWARPWASVLAAIFVLMTLANVGAAGSVLGVAYPAVRGIIAIAAVVLLWLPPSTAFLRVAARPAHSAR